MRGPKKHEVGAAVFGAALGAVAGVAIEGLPPEVVQGNLDTAAQRGIETDEDRAGREEVGALFKKDKKSDNVVGGHGGLTLEQIKEFFDDHTYDDEDEALEAVHSFVRNFLQVVPRDRIWKKAERDVLFRKMMDAKDVTVEQRLDEEIKSKYYFPSTDVSALDKDKSREVMLYAPAINKLSEQNAYLIMPSYGKESGLINGNVDVSWGVIKLVNLVPEDAAKALFRWSELYIHYSRDTDAIRNDPALLPLELAWRRYDAEVKYYKAFQQLCAEFGQDFTEFGRGWLNDPDSVDDFGRSLNPDKSTYKY